MRCGWRWPRCSSVTRPRPGCSAPERAVNGCGWWTCAGWAIRRYCATWSGECGCPAGGDPLGQLDQLGAQWLGPPGELGLLPGVLGPPGRGLDRHRRVAELGEVVRAGPHVQLADRHGQLEAVRDQLGRGGRSQLV